MMKKFLAFLIASAVLACLSCSDDSEDPAEPDEPAEIKIGNFYGGGIIFYIDDSGEHGLVCAIQDQNEGTWCLSGDIINVADGTEIGTGAQNTEDIVLGCSESGSAASICSSLSLNDFDDWFLPSKDELNEMYLRKDIINEAAVENGGHAFKVTPFIYWCSTEDGDYTAFAQSMDNGFQYVGGKHDTNRIRAIRAF